ncbi:nicastrin [Lampris incognitus]|uniref:nicastrin n=1 Tax=Lampris incognitus TaxID=2546036 RepID=UPI0024B57DFC|nr:nicastrin [Lampris incognitus]
MDLLSIKWAIIFLISILFNDSSCNSVEQKIYVQLNNTVPCVRLLNATHQIGCQSSISGNVGVIHLLESEENLDWVLRTGPNPPYMVLLEWPLFTRSVMIKLKTGSSRVAGVAVVGQNTNPPEGFSPHTTCPNENTGVYSDSYGPLMANCNGTVWNPLGNGLSYENFDFPIFHLKEDNETQVIRQCYFDHNHAVNGSAPQYPLCAMQLFSHMHAVTDTATCMRRNDINFSIIPEVVCDPLGDFNVWGSTKPLNSTAKGHKEEESMVIAAARLDSRSFFSEVAPGAESGVSGFVTLLAAAHALHKATQAAHPPRTILYTFFQGEAFDYIGSSRMVYEMGNDQFAIDLDNIHSVLEIGQVGLGKGSGLWLHSDPVSRRNSSSINNEVRTLIGNLQSAATDLNISLVEPTVSQPLPPSSFQRFLRAQPIPGIVITDHQTAFANRYYESMYDNAAYLNLTYPPNLTPEQQLEFVTETARALTELATVIARALYKQAGGDDAQVANIIADPQIVTQMLYGFLVRSNNSWFQAVIPPELQSLLKSEPPEYYVGVALSSSLARTSTRLVQYVLANLTGTALNISQENCQNQRIDEEDKESKHMYSFLWVQGPATPNGTEREGLCVRSSVRLSKAVSPAFDLLQEYNSKDYSTWTESRWKFISARIFLVASHDLQMLTLGVGVAVLLMSLLLTYVITSKADILFSSGREPTNATY